MKKVIVDIADYKVCKGEAVLETVSLGSCVGIVLYDMTAKIGGMAHIMLPDSSLSKIHSNPKKFADSSIRSMLNEMKKLGAVESRVKAKIAGGASMFESVGDDKILDIGGRNIQAVKKILNELKVCLEAEDTGKNYGRTIEFNIETGKLFVRAALHATKEY